MSSLHICHVLNDDRVCFSVTKMSREGKMTFSVPLVHPIYTSHERIKLSLGLL